jgi:hypothetical protein
MAPSWAVACVGVWTSGWAVAHLLLLVSTLLARGRLHHCHQLHLWAVVLIWSCHRRAAGLALSPLSLPLTTVTVSPRLCHMTPSCAVACVGVWTSGWAVAYLLLSASSFLARARLHHRHQLHLRSVIRLGPCHLRLAGPALSPLSLPLATVTVSPCPCRMAPSCAVACVGVWTSGWAVAHLLLSTSSFLARARLHHRHHLHLWPVIRFVSCYGRTAGLAPPLLSLPLATVTVLPRLCRMASLWAVASVWVWTSGWAAAHLLLSASSLRARARIHQWHQFHL